MSLKPSLIVCITISTLFLGACSSNQSTNTASSPTATQPTETKPSASASPAASPTTSAKGEKQSHGGQGGQVIETGEYHLELVTLKEGNGTHLDFYLQKGDKHEAISNARVTAQVQLPNGTQKSPNMKYDASGKHYYTVLPSTAAGEYKVAILSDIKGEKVNGRFSFKR